MATKIIDFTKTKSRNKRFQVCPKCKRIGKLTKYTDRTRHYVHAGHIFAGMFFEVTDSCFIPWEEFKGLIKKERIIEEV